MLSANHHLVDLWGLNVLKHGQVFMYENESTLQSKVKRDSEFRSLTAEAQGRKEGAEAKYNLVSHCKTTCIEPQRHKGAEKTHNCFGKSIAFRITKDAFLCASFAPLRLCGEIKPELFWEIYRLQNNKRCLFRRLLPPPAPHRRIKPIFVSKNSSPSEHTTPLSNPSPRPPASVG